MLKKVFSVVLAIVLVFSSFPCYAFAEDIDVSEPMAEASQTESGNTDATEGEDTDATEAEETSSDAEDKVGEEFDEESENPLSRAAGKGRRTLMRRFRLLRMPRTAEAWLLSVLL